MSSEPFLEEPEWPLMAGAAWVATRSATIASEMVGKGRARLAATLIYDRAVSDAPDGQMAAEDAEKAMAALLLAVRQGLVKASGIKDGEFEPQDLPAKLWTGLMICFDGNVGRNSQYPSYFNVSVDRASLLKAFPPEASSTNNSGDERNHLPARKRGPKEKYPWARFFAQCEVYWTEYAGAWDDGRSFIDSPAPLEKLMDEWCANKAPRKQWGDGPGLTQLRKKVGEFLARKAKEAS